MEELLSLLRIFPSGNAYGNQWSHPDRKLHQSRWTEVYTTDVVAEEVEFAESKATSDALRNNSGMGGGYQPQAPSAPSPSGAAGDGFMNIPDGIDEELPFN